MPFPDELPPEIWNHIVSISRPDRSHLIPWLQVSPFSYAKGMHDTAFVHIFRTLHIRMRGDWLSTILQLWNYLKEARLRRAVREFSCLWRASTYHWYVPLATAPERSMNMMEEMLCEVLNNLENLRELSWSNDYPCACPINDTIYKSLEHHFPSLTKLEILRVEFDRPLDLRSATSLSTLSMTNVRLTSTFNSPSVLLDTKIGNLLISDILSRDIAFLRGVFYGMFPSEGPWNSASDIIAFLDLSEITILHIGDRQMEFSNNDLLHLFPPTPSPKSVGDQLVKISIFRAGPPTITILSKCQAFSKLRYFRVRLVFETVVAEGLAGQALLDLSSFIGRQKALTDLEVNITQAEHEAHIENLPEENIRALEDELAGDSWRNALACLKNLRRLSLATHMLGMRYPVLNEAFARAVPNLETLIINCVSIVRSLSHNKLTRAFDGYPNLRLVKVNPQYPKKDEEALILAKKLSRAIGRRAPRIQYCSVQQHRFRIGADGAEEITLLDPDAEEVFRMLDWPRVTVAPTDFDLHSLE